MAPTFMISEDNSSHSHSLLFLHRILILSLASLAWPLKRHNALKLLEELGMHKSIGLTTEAV